MAEAIVAPAVCADIKHTLNFDCGIYAIISPGGRRYIGQAQSFYARWAQHQSLLKKGEHHCRALQRAWVKYGSSSFVFAKIAIVPTGELNRREQEQLDAYVNSGNRDLLYNVSLCAEASARGRPVPKEIRDRISASSKGRKRSTESIALTSGSGNGFFGKRHTEEAKARVSAANSKNFAAHRKISKPVICVELEKQFSGMSEAVRWLRENGRPSASISPISTSCTNPTKTAYGYTWRLATDTDRTSMIGRSRSGENCPRSIAVICVETSMRFVSMLDAERWLRSHGKPKAALTNIAKVCRNPEKTAYGYHWDYA